MKAFAFSTAAIAGILFGPSFVSLPSRSLRSAPTEVSTAGVSAPFHRGARPAQSASRFAAVSSCGTVAVLAYSLYSARTKSSSASAAQRGRSIFSVRNGSHRGPALKAFEQELGVQPPVGYWDPCGLSKDGDLTNFNRRRTVELKHSRVCMLACLGYMLPEYYKWPGLCSPSQKIAFQDIPNGLAAMSKIPGAGWAQIVLFLGFVETGFYPSNPNRPPGDYENGGVLGVPNGSTLVTGDDKTRRLSAELANGRLAMFAIIGMFFQDGLTGSAWGSWANYASPMR